MLRGGRETLDDHYGTPGRGKGTAGKVTVYTSSIGRRRRTKVRERLPRFLPRTRYLPPSPTAPANGGAGTVAAADSAAATTAAVAAVVNAPTVAATVPTASLVTRAGSPPVACWGMGVVVVVGERQPAGGLGWWWWSGEAACWWMGVVVVIGRGRRRALRFFCAVGAMRGHATSTTSRQVRVRAPATWVD